MGNYKYQILNFNLFDYMGVEAHLEKMAVKGWRFDSVVGVLWRFLKSEPKKLNYSVTYLPKHSEFAPEPSEEQLDMEAYCREAGWRKAGNWAQMQIFCTDNPDAVPIETDESLRLELIHKIQKKNLLISYVALLLIFLMDAFFLYQMMNNGIEFLANARHLWSCGMLLWGLFFVIFDIGYYVHWYKRAKKAVEQGDFCPEPKGYRYFSRVAWYVVAALFLGAMGANSGGGAGFMILYLAGILLLVFIVQKVKEYCKEAGMSKGANLAVTLIVDAILAIAMTAGITKAAMLFDWNSTGEPDAVEFYDIGKRSYMIYEEELPLYIEDLMEVDYEKRSCYAKENSSILLGHSEYRETMLVPNVKEPIAMALYYEVITVKADWLYDFAMEAFYKQEFRYAEEGEREKTEYRPAYESEKGRLYRQYYEGLPVAYEWLMLSENKIVPITIFAEELSEVQMETIVSALAGK